MTTREQKLADALKFYADSANYAQPVRCDLDGIHPIGMSSMEIDVGQKAREALASQATTEEAGATKIETDFLADDARSEMDKVNQLTDYLNRHLGYEPRAGEWLSQYRKYLDSKAIRAEVNGWPSPEAHSFFNVRKFVEHKKESQ